MTSEPVSVPAAQPDGHGSEQTGSGHAALNKRTNSLWSSAVGRIQSSEDWLFWSKVGMVLGGSTLAGIGGAMADAPASAATTGLAWKSLLTFGGIGIALVGGILVSFMERGGAALLDDARQALELAREFLAQKDQYYSRIVELEELDNRRRALIQGSNLMREAIEQAVIADEATLDNAAKFMLDAACPSLQRAIGLEGGELWAFSIFQVQSIDGVEILKRIAAHRADRLTEQNDPRSWLKNEGYVGGAWHNNRDVIIADGASPEALAEYPVPAMKRREYDSDRYCSMAAIPVRIGADRVWGVVAASSNRVGRFKRDAINPKAQSVDTVRSLARMMALLAAAFERKA